VSHAVTAPIAPFQLPSGAVVHGIPAASDNLVWLVVRPDGGAVIVDGPTAGEALDVLDGLGARLDAVWITHTHGDHIGVLHDLDRRGRLGGVRVIGPDDVPFRTERVDEGDTSDVGGLVAQVWRTEGHLDGHLSYVLDGAVFCGDTMFAGGCGRLFSGPPAKMWASLQRLAALPPETRGFCAHEYTWDNLEFAWSVDDGNPALQARIDAVRAIRAGGGCTVPFTIAEERATNPFLRATDPVVARRAAALTPGVDPGDALAVFTALRARKDTGKHRGVLPAI
jgi:hydroxyacylglutathione hydrolase